MSKSPKTGSEELGELLRARRAELGMTRRELVDATGLSYPYVSQLETGYRLPSSTALRDLAGALQISTDALASVLPAERSGPRGTASRSRWISNPDYQSAPSAMPGPTRGSGRRRPSAIVAEVVDLLASLPPDQRLDALAKVQRALMAGLVDEAVHRSDPAQ